MTDTVVFPGTLQEALQSSLILPSSRLLLRAGSYTLGDLSCTLSDITIMPYPGETATIAVLSGYRCLLLNNVSNVTVDGLIFDGTFITNEAVKITGNTTNVIIQNCEIKNATRHGILISGTPTGCQIINNHVHHCGSGGLDHGIYLSGVGVTVTGNEIDNITGMGIHCYGPGQTDAYTIEKNYVHDCPDRGIGCYYGTATIRNNVIRAANMGLQLSTHLITANVYHNTITDCDGSGLAAQAPDVSCALDIKNNLFDSNNYALAIENAGGQYTATLRNNLYSQSTTDDEDIAGTVDSSGNISQTCTPVTDSGATFTPGVGNPAKGAGVVIASVTTDYGGNARGNPPTIGAWE